jgi:hypothetical protein
MTFEIQTIKSRIAAIKSRHGLAEDAPVGIFATFDTKAALDTENGNNDVLAIATTDNVDLDDEVVLPSGCDWSYLNANRKLFVDHQYDISHCVGALRSMAPYPSKGAMKGWSIRARLYDGMPYPAAEAVQKIIAQDGIGISIGFLALDYGAPTADERIKYPGASSIVRKSKLLEASFTCLPCNVSCQTQRVSIDDSKAANIAAHVDAKARDILSIKLPRLSIKLPPAS